ncbi:lipopolysaccharide biosynthesis [Roseobacter sp. YSTF-M11]|uniref:Lipopolysaccharide biosynthesis n=1 Tax=Roseobacter insulae TaxID=2859783 RepID=A0A9X1G0P0_9RHOB|nr:lipopolysaccharide biosynthesis [Roseobacter insulae]MBW4710764.1 lipopolysaccharide biosynthesis [Roseobacter insulae]
MITDIGFYFKLLSRRFPAMAALLLLCACIGVVVALRLPTTYESSATLLVESAQISSDAVRATTQVDASEQLEVIQQRLLTRANLLDIARTARIFPNQSTMNPDVVVNHMRKKTKIRRASGRDKATLMTVGFEGTNPQKVAAVVNQYVNLVLEANSDFRTARAEGTLEFFEQEVDTLSQNLDAQSAKIVEFKRQNADALPENLDYRLNRQSLLQERLARAERDLEALQTQRTSIQRIYESTGRLETIANVPLTPEQERLRALEGQLRVSLSIYSETNPKVRLLRSQINALKQQMTDLPGAEGAGETPTQVTALDVSLTEIDARLQALRQEIATTNAELAKLQDSIDRTPANRIALNAMERDQDNMQALYSAAVQRMSQARMGERIELSAKGERITVLEPANVPNSPSGPNRAGIAGMGVFAGLGLAGGLFVLLELLNQTIRRPSEITRALEITPLAVIPRYETAADRRRRRILQLATIGVVITVVPTVLWAIDTYYMPLDQLFEKIVGGLI